MDMGIDGLHPEFQRLRTGGVYWVACHRSGDAEALCRQILSRMASPESCAIVSVGMPVEPILASIDADAEGPGVVRTYLLADTDLAAALQVFDDEISRVWRGSPPGLLILLAPLPGLAALDDAALRAALVRMHAWLDGHGGRVLWITHGQSAALAPRLLPFCDLLYGLAQAYPDQGALRYLVHHWSSELGVQAAHEFTLGETPGGWRVIPDSARMPFADDAGDRFLNLAQEEVLEGAPMLSSEWRIFSDWSALANAATIAQASSVLFAIHGNSQVDELAQVLYGLRARRGAALRLVIREMAPCLRYADERLLLGCGANLIVPHGAPLARFLTLVESTRGNIWQGRLPDDPQSLIRAYRPPRISGLVAPAQFRRVVADIEADTVGSGLENATLALQPLRGVRPDQALSQCAIRRQGDVACIHDGRVYVFLFACRQDGVERALDNLFRLPWREMFSGYERVMAHDLVGMREETVTPYPGMTAMDARRELREEVHSLPAPKPLRLNVGSDVP